MFASWRKLAATAGALCFPLSVVQGSIQCDEGHCTRSAAHARYEESAEQTWLRAERDSWYERYYSGTLENTLSDLTPPRLTDSIESADKPSVIILPIEPIDDIFDDATTTSDDGCDDPNCPCHKTADQDEKTNQAAPSSRDRAGDVRVPSFEIESEFFDVYMPYVCPRDLGDISSEPQPTAELEGTIEPIFEADEDDGIDQWFSDSSGLDSNTFLNDVETVSPNDDSDATDESDSDIDYENPNDRPERLHMFYPGCDWTPYYPGGPASKGSQAVLPEDVRSA